MTSHATSHSRHPREETATARFQKSYQFSGNVDEFWLCGRLVFAKALRIFRLFSCLAPTSRRGSARILHPIPRSGLATRFAAITRGSVRTLRVLVAVGADARIIDAGSVGSAAPHLNADLLVIGSFFFGWAFSEDAGSAFLVFGFALPSLSCTGDRAGV